MGASCDKWKYATTHHRTEEQIHINIQREGDTEE
jgi:hypothetical protein